MPLTASFPIVLQVLDSSGNPAQIKLVDFPYDPARGLYNATTLTDNNPHALPLPPYSPVYQVYIKNNDPDFALTVNWTPAGQAQDLADVLAPGGFILLADQQLQQGGVTAVSLTSANPAGCPYESFLGG